MDILFIPLLHLVKAILGLYKLCLITFVIMSWLELLGILNRYNNIVYSIHNILHSITEPLLRPLRRIIPNIKGFDIAPLVMFLLIYYIEILIGCVLLRFPS